MSKKLQFAVLILGIAAAAAVGILLVSDEEEETTGEDISAMLESRYQSEVSSMSQTDGIFTARMETDTGLYNVEIDRESGDILSIEQTEVLSGEENEEEEVPEYLQPAEVETIVLEETSGEADILDIRLDEREEGSVYEVEFSLDDQNGRMELDAVTGAVQVYTLEDETPIEPLSEEEAVEIAMREHSGTLDDIDLDEDGGRLIYEIEIENESTGVDADIILDAYSGEILSVEFDD